MRIVSRSSSAVLLRAALVAGGITVCIPGCITGGGYSSRDRVTEAAREYNDSVRWGRLERAATHVPKAARQRFFDRHQDLESELSVVDCEVRNLDLNEKKDRAVVRVEYTWTINRRGLVEKTSIDQVWEQQDREWLVMSETRVSGAPMVLFDEPRRAHSDALTDSAAAVAPASK